MGSSLRPRESRVHKEKIPIRLRVRKRSVSIRRAFLTPRTGVILHVTRSPQAS